MPVDTRVVHRRMGTMIMIAAYMQHVSRGQQRKLHQSDARGGDNPNFRGEHGHQSFLNSESDQLLKYTVGSQKHVRVLQRVYVFLTIKFK